jgi:hypothetical protein
MSQDAELKEYRLQRTGNTDIRFTGKLLGTGDSKGKPSGAYSYQVDIYRTRGGTWIGYVTTFMDGRQWREDAILGTNPTELRKKLLKAQDNDSFKTALGIASQNDELFVENID